jgi:acyl-CoA synthetase (AMP-forming)/AMP-acid ligase II
MPLIQLLRQAGSEAPALVFEGSTLSRHQLEALVSHVAGCLRRAGVEPASKVLVALPNSPAFLVSLLAVNACHALFMPVSPRLTPDERRRVDGIASPDFVVSEEHGSIELMPGAFLSRNASVADHDEDLADVSAILFTSGTIGMPRGVMMTEDALVANARAVAGYLQLTGTDRTLVFLPAYYTYTLSQILSTWLAGGSVVLMPNLRYPMQAFMAIAEHEITGFGGVPTSLNVLASHLARSSASHASLRYILSAGAPLAPALAERIQRIFPRAALFNNYGCTEIGPRATAVDVTAHPTKLGSVGRAIAGVSVTIVRPDLSVADTGEIGEIVLGGASLMKGYYGDPDATFARMSLHGFHTGDYAYADSEGFLYFQGRRDDMFKSAGEKVSATEIENVVIAHEAVGEAAVVPLPDPILGAVPVVYVVIRPGWSLTERDLRAFCAQHLSRHKVPRTVHFVDELQKTATGKVQKHRLKEPLSL